jgi:hypothetical protein
MTRKVTSFAVLAGFLGLAAPAAAQFPHGIEPRQMFPNDIGAAERAGAIADQATTYADWLNTIIDAARDWGEFTDGYRHLNGDDAAYDPNYSPPGSPEVPISCETEECMQCYERSVNRINFVRQTFERLRAIYSSTTKMANAAIAFGDTTSGIHAVTGLAWQSSKIGIMQELEKLGKTYDEKYTGLLATLQSALQDMAKCEQEHFDNPDWYNRFGFIYYTFMADRYRRDG